MVQIGRWNFGQTIQIGEGDKGKCPPPPPPPPPPPENLMKTISCVKLWAGKKDLTPAVAVPV